MRTKVITSLMAAGLVFLGISGCVTVWGAKDPPTLRSTTSAEQTERLFWAMVRDKKWQDISPLLAPNLVYVVRGRVLSRDQVIPFLQSEQFRDFVLGDVIVKPNGPDMTVSYTLQLSSPDGKTRSLIVVSVWQQVRSGWILAEHSEQPQNEGTP
jgi:Domain of unknown function (DUF4440)